VGTELGDGHSAARIQAGPNSSPRQCGTREKKLLVAGLCALAFELEAANIRPDRGWEGPGLMREVLLCTLLMLALPQFAAAAGALGVFTEPGMTGDRTPDRAAAPAATARRFELGLDGAHLRFAQNAPEEHEQGGDAPRAKGDISPYQAQSDRGLSFGFEIKPRSRYGDLARKHDAEDQGFDDRLDNLIERPVFGFRGRYRF
jgi:hypothetical protein